MRLLIMLGVAAALSGCAAQIEPRKFVGPNGREAYVMRCSGMMRTLEACYIKAGEVCPSGYSVVSQDSSTVIVPTSNGMIGAPRQTLAVECK